MKRRKGIIRAAGVLIECVMVLAICWSMYYQELLSYAFSQAKGQLTIVWAARPVEQVLKDETVPDSLKYKLALITEIKKFAVDSLGIRDSENYSSLFDQKGQPVLWAVSAADRFEMKAYEWRFPFLGAVPYKGYFNKWKGMAERYALDRQGYDTEFRTVSGWSTLGWFNDPILSNMLKRTEGDIANLIIHELTHGTLFVKSSVSFNENLASFVGDKGAIRFLEYKYGRESKEYQAYLLDRADGRLYNNYVLKSTKRLDSLYHSFGPAETTEEKERRKMKLIREIVDQVKFLPLHNKSAYFRSISRAMKDKNAFFMGFKRYDEKYDLFEEEFRDKFNSDIKKYLVHLKEKYPSVDL